MFSKPQVNLYTADLPRSVAFYERLGFEERFRTPRQGEPIHVELALDGFTLGVATVESVGAHHGVHVMPGARSMEVVVWTEDVDGAVASLEAPVLSAPHDWLDGRLRVAWVSDPDGNAVQLVEQR